VKQASLALSSQARNLPSLSPVEASRAELLARLDAPLLRVLQAFDWLGSAPPGALSRDGLYAAQPV